LKQLQLIQILHINTPKPAAAELAAANVRRVNAKLGRREMRNGGAGRPDRAFAARKSGEWRPPALYRPVTLTSLRSGNLAKRAGGRRVVVIPAGTGHWFTRIEDHIDYIMVRIDPDKVTPLKSEAQSAEYLSKPAKRGE
jgi:hypothetical protein